MFPFGKVARPKIIAIGGSALSFCFKMKGKGGGRNSEEEEGEETVEERRLIIAAGLF